MIPCVDLQVIEKAFTTSKGLIPIQLKPEAPWVKKDAVSGSIKFTDEIYATDDSDGKSTPESKENNDKKNKNQIFDEFEG
jgi:hypothetical protein